MNISINLDKVNIKDGKLIIDVDTNIQSIYDNLKCRDKCRDTIKLSDLKPKDEFKIGDDEVFVVLEQTDNGTRVIAKEFAYYDVEFGYNSDWKVSPIRKILHDKYFSKISSIIGANNILPMNRDLTSLDGLDDYGTCVDTVSLLTYAEYAKYHKILGLDSDYPDCWWLITPGSTPSNNYDDGICFINSYGALSWNVCRCTYGVRPFLNLKSSITVTVI